MDVKIKEITIQLGKKELKLSLEEAKQLHTELESLFRVPVFVAPYTYDKYVQPFYPRDPWIVYTSSDTITLGADTATMSWKAA